MKKKLIGFALSAAMLFASLSVPAFAAAPETPAEADAPAAAVAAEPAPEEENTAAPEEETAEQSAPEEAAPVEEAAPAAEETAVTAETSEEKEPEQLTYVALGDSICAGIGLTNVQYSHNLMGVDVSYNFKGYPEASYVGQVADMLGLDRDHAINLGLPGAMSKDIVEMTSTGTMKEMNMLSGCQYDYPEFIDYIKSADVISVQLGSNDAFVPTVVSFGEATSWKSEDLASIVLSGNLRGGNQEAESALRESLKKLKLTRSEKDAIWKLFFTGMDEICENAYPESTSNLRQIIENIQALNPDAQILIVGATNPVPLLSSWSNYFNKLNKYEKQLADVYGCTYVAVPFAQTELDGHPTVSGHKYIARKIVRAIEANQ